MSDIPTRPNGYAHPTPAQQELMEFVKKVVKIRAEQPVFQRRHFFQGRAFRGSSVKDISWLAPDGEEMDDEAWDAGFTKPLTVFLNGRAISEPDPRGERVADDSFLLLFNGSEEDLRFTVPPRRYGTRWSKVRDTASTDSDFDRTSPVKPGDTITLVNHSLQLLRRG